MLKIHFLNVGHGDCCIVDFLDSGRLAVVDINRSDTIDKSAVKEIYESSGAASRDTTNWQLMYDAGITKTATLLEKAGYTIALQDPIDYLKDLGKNRIFRFISTHPHMDHLTGLATLKKEIPYANFWVIKNSYSQDEKKLTDNQKEDWGLYKKYRDTDEREEDGVTIIRPQEKSIADYYTEDGIKILSPTDGLISAGDKNANEMSYVLLIEHKGNKILLPGDAEEATWKHLVENYKEELQDITVLKAAHHGRDSGYYEPALEIMSPLLTVVSVGKKPDTDASNKYRKHSKNVWSTRWKGNITLEIDNDGKITSDTQYDR